MIDLDEFDLHLWFYMFLGMLALVREVQMLIAEAPPGEEIGAESRSMEEGASDADDVPSPLAEDNEEAMTVIVTPGNSTEDVLKKNRNSDEYASGTKESKLETELDMRTRCTSRTSKTMSLSCRSKYNCLSQELSLFLCDAPYRNDYQWDATAIDKIIRQLNRYICPEHSEYEKELFPNDTIIRDVIATSLSSDDSRATLKAVLLKTVLSLPDPNHMSAAGRSETAEIGDQTNDLRPTETLYCRALEAWFRQHRRQHEIYFASAQAFQQKRRMVYRMKSKLRVELPLLILNP